MRLDFWNKRDCECQCAPLEPIVPPAKEEMRVCRMSPARLLANSLTDPETRGEWKREREKPHGGLGQVTAYRNAKRDLVITSWWAGGYGYFGSGITTPFTLSDAEQKIVKAAIQAFNRRLKDEDEAKALSRLTAPREGLKPDRGETPKSGSTAKRRKPDPKGRAK